ncbi:unnamed protein product, partial [marine sediment metagenome]
MAFNLDATLVEASDNSKITITDTTPDYGAGSIQDVFDNGTATVTLTIRGIAYDAIDVKSYFDGGNQGNLEFDVMPEDLKISTSPQFVAGDDFPDGDVNNVYAVTNATESDSVTKQDLVYGVIEKEVLDFIR